MAITVEAVVENGLLRPMQPLPLKEKDRVQITIQGIATHTSRALSLEEIGQELKEASQMVDLPSVPLKHRVDYTQVF